MVRTVISLEADNITRVRDNMGRYRDNFPNLGNKILREIADEWKEELINQGRKVFSFHRGRRGLLGSIRINPVGEGFNITSFGYGKVVERGRKPGKLKTDKAGRTFRQPAPERAKIDRWAGMIGVTPDALRFILGAQGSKPKPWIAPAQTIMLQRMGEIADERNKNFAKSGGRI